MTDIHEQPTGEMSPLTQPEWDFRKGARKIAILLFLPFWIVFYLIAYPTRMAISSARSNDEPWNDPESIYYTQPGPAGLHRSSVGVRVRG